MAGEHQHEWMYSLQEQDATLRECSCGARHWFAPASRLMAMLKQFYKRQIEVEQQLAQAREENAQAWALLARLVALEPYRFNERFRNVMLHSMFAERVQVSDHEACPYCAGTDIGVALQDEMKPLGFPGLHINHTQDCPWLQARAFLAQHQE
jgi:hypothetical protein